MANPVPIVTLQDLKNTNELNLLFRNLNEEVDDLFKGLNSVSDEITKQNRGYNLAKKSVNSLIGIVGKVKDIQDNIKDANVKDLATLKEKVISERKNLVEAQELLEAKRKNFTISNDELAALTNINGILSQQDGLLQQINNTLTQSIANARKVEDTMGDLGAVTDAFGEGLNRAGLGALESRLGLKDALKSTKDMVTAGEGNVGKMKAAGHLAKQLGSNLMKSLGPYALLVIAVEQIVEAFKLIDNSSGEVAKNMGISVKEGRELVAASNDAALMSGDLLISTKDVLKAQMDLNKQFGTSVKFSNKLATEFAKIQERTGLSEEAMGIFAEQALISNTTIKDQLADVVAVNMEMSAQSGIMLNQKDIQEGIKDISNAQRLINKFNTKELARQVIESKKLGASMSQLEQISSNLLDFESSIASEMEAELLTGKQLNLEAARYAALMGNQADLASEIRSQIGSSAEFGEMNVIQQEALAKSFGLSREDLAGMLVEQEKLNAVQKAGFSSLSDAQEKYNKALAEGNLSEELRLKLQEANLLNQFESATAQDKLTAATEKLTDLFVALVEPLMPIIDAIISILDPIAASLSPIFKMLGDLVNIIMTVLKPGFAAIEKYAKGVADLWASIFNLDFDGVINALKNMGQAIIDFLYYPLQGFIDLLNKIPGVNLDFNVGEEVGKFIGLAEGGIVTKPTTALIGEGGEPEAVVPLSKAESLGFTGLSSQPQQGNISISNEESKRTNQLLEKLISAIEKGGNVYIDGNQVGKSLVLANSRLG
jgi:hypothetical protein